MDTDRLSREARSDSGDQIGEMEESALSMAGRKRKIGVREPNGRLQRPSKIEREQYTRRVEEAEMATVLAQPHRLGSRDQMCASALGRFVIAQRLRGEVYDAAEAYSELVRSWRAAKGVPTNVRAHIGAADGDGPSDETVQAWAIQIAKIEMDIVQGGPHNPKAMHAAYLGMRRLVLDDADLPSALWDVVSIALGQLAIAMRMLPHGGHPFLSMN